MRSIKKSILIFYLFIFLSHLLYAQNKYEEEGASLGVRIGVNASLFDFADAEESIMPGANISLFSKANVVQRLSIQPELTASMQRISVKFNNDNFKNEMDFSFYYAEFAFLAAYNISYSVSFHSGPYISYLVHFEEKEKSGSASSQAFKKTNFSDVNYGFIFGSTYELKRFDIGFRYNLGLHDIGKKTEAENTNTLLSTKNSYLLLYGGYVF